MIKTKRTGKIPISKLIRALSGIPKKIDNIIANKISMKCFNAADKSKLKSLEFSVKINYINEFEWIWNKQKDQIRDFNLTTRKKIKNKLDRRRNRHRKAKIDQEERRKRAQNTILNKSSFVITDEQKILLLHGLNFAPTPKWTSKTKNHEYLNLV